MSKADPSNLTLNQFELLNDLIPEPKLGGRPREVDMWEIRSRHFLYSLSRVSLAGFAGETSPPGRRCIPNERNWRKDGTWVRIHDSLREIVRVELGRQPSPTFAIIDSQSVKSAAIVSQAVGFDAGKLIKGRKRFLTVDTLGLVLLLLVTAASIGEREGGKRALKPVKQMGKAVSRLHTIWVDGGNDCAPFMLWVMDVCRWIVQVVLRPEQTCMICLAQKTLGSGAHFRLDDGHSAISQRRASYFLKHRRHLFTLP